MGRILQLPDSGSLDRIFYRCPEIWEGLKTEKGILRQKGDYEPQDLKEFDMDNLYFQEPLPPNIIKTDGEIELCRLLNQPRRPRILPGERSFSALWLDYRMHAQSVLRELPKRKEMENLDFCDLNFFGTIFSTGGPCVLQLRYAHRRWEPNLRPLKTIYRSFPQERSLVLNV